MVHRFPEFGCIFSQNQKWTKTLRKDFKLLKWIAICGFPLISFALCNCNSCYCYYYYFAVSYLLVAFVDQYTYLTTLYILKVKYTKLFIHLNCAWTSMNEWTTIAVIYPVKQLPKESRCQKAFSCIHNCDGLSLIHYTVNSHLADTLLLQTPW